MRKENSYFKCVVGEAKLRFLVDTGVAGKIILLRCNP